MFTSHVYKQRHIDKQCFTECIYPVTCINICLNKFKQVYLITTPQYQGMRLAYECGRMCMCVRVHFADNETNPQATACNNPMLRDANAGLCKELVRLFFY